MSNAIEAHMQLEELRETLKTLKSFELTMRFRGRVTFCYKTQFISREKHNHMPESESRILYTYIKARIPKVERDIKILENKLKKVQV